MSDSVRPELASFRELEGLIRAVGEELAWWRRRALRAEARARELEEAYVPKAEPGAPRPHPRVAELERENAELREKLSAARERAKQLLARIRFLRQQHAGEADR